MQNERDKAVLELAEEKSGTQALLKEFKKLRDRVFNETSSSNLVSEKQEKRVTTYENFSFSCFLLSLYLSSHFASHE